MADGWQRASGEAPYLSLGGIWLVRGPGRLAVDGAGPRLAPGVVGFICMRGGRALFEQSWVVCHGASAQGGIGHSLHRLQLSGAQVAVTVKDRIKPVMPPLKQKYPAPDSEALVAYVRSLRE